MSEEHSTQPMADQPAEDNPIGDMLLPGRPSFAAKVYALAGSTVGLGIFAVIGTADTGTSITPTPTR